MDQRNKQITSILIAIFVFGFLSFPYANRPADAEPVTWAKSYGFVIESIQQTSDGGYINAGNGDVFKLDSDGNVEWAKNFSQIRSRSVSETSDGGYIVVGSLTNSNGVPDTLVIKLDSDGNTEWQKIYDVTDSDGARSVHETLDGGFIVGGWAHDLGVSAGLLLLKLDSDGNTVWEKTFPSEDATGAIVQPTGDGGYIVTGTSYIVAFGSGGDFWVAKLDSNGNIEWEKSYGPEEDQPQSIEQTSDGGFVVAGLTSFSDSDSWVIKLDSNGNIQWQKSYAIPFADQKATSVRQTSDGGYIVGGLTDDHSSSIDPLTWLIKLDSDGNIEWEKGYATSPGRGVSVQTTSDGGYVAAAVSVLKLDSEGNISNCNNSDLIEETNATVLETDSPAIDTSLSVIETDTTPQNQDLLVTDAVAEVVNLCEPPPPVFDYSLSLFENISDPSDGVVALNQSVRVLAETDDDSVDQVIFRWYNPVGDVARETIAPISSPEDLFAPDEQGTWFIEADFGNGQILRETVSISFFVLPESPIGAVAMMVASMVSLGAFLYFRMARKPRIDL